MESNLSHLALSDNGFLFDSSTGHTYTLNATGTSILKGLISRLPLEQIIASMTEEYDASGEILARDLDQFLHFLKDLGLVGDD